MQGSILKNCPTIDKKFEVINLNKKKTPPVYTYFKELFFYQIPYKLLQINLVENEDRIDYIELLLPILPYVAHYA